MTTEITNASRSSQGTPSRWPKHAAYLGVATTMIGFISYYTFFFQFPALRDFPVVNLPLVLLGVIMTAAGTWGVFRQSGLLGRCLAAAGMLLVIAIAGLFNFYIFSMSYQLPDSSEAAARQSAAPAFTLPDPKGQNVSLSDYRGKKVVLVFYRGHW